MFFNFRAEDDLICQEDHSNVLDDFCSKNFKFFDIGGFLFDDELDLEVVVFYYVGVVNFEKLLSVNVEVRVGFMHFVVHPIFDQFFQIVFEGFDS